MLILRREQIDELGKSSHRNFMQRLKRVIREKHAGLIQNFPTTEIEGVLDELFGVSRGYGLIVEADVYEFTIFSLIFGIGFERRPPLQWAGEILQKTGLKPEQKLFQVRERLKETYQNNDMRVVTSLQPAG